MECGYDMIYYFSNAYLMGVSEAEPSVKDISGLKLYSWQIVHFLQCGPWNMLFAVVSLSSSNDS